MGRSLIECKLRLLGLSSFEKENVTMVEQLIKCVAYINVGFDLVKKRNLQQTLEMFKILTIKSSIPWNLLASYFSNSYNQFSATRVLTTGLFSLGVSPHDPIKHLHRREPQLSSPHLHMVARKSITPHLRQRIEWTCRTSHGHNASFEWGNNRAGSRVRGNALTHNTVTS